MLLLCGARDTTHGTMSGAGILLWLQRLLLWLLLRSKRATGRIKGRDEREGRVQATLVHLLLAAIHAIPKRRPGEARNENGEGKEEEVKGKEGCWRAGRVASVGKRW